MPTDSGQHDDRTITVGDCYAGGDDVVDDASLSFTARNFGARGHG